MLLSIYNNDIAITIYGWFEGHAGTCLGVACFVSGGDMYGFGCKKNKKFNYKFRKCFEIEYLESTLS